MTNMIAIYQSGYAIFGYGKTLSRAIADANGWLEAPITADDLGSERIHGELCEITISPAVAVAVKELGGHIRIVRREDGVYDLPASDA